MPTTTRGPLPPGVYWRRRLAVLSVALVLVLSFGKLLGRAGGDDDPTAARVGALASPTVTVTADPTDAPTSKAGKDGKNGGKRNGGKNAGQDATAEETPAAVPTPEPTPTTPPPLAEPTGPCPDDDVFVTATVDGAVGTTDVTVMLNLQTRATPACTFEVSPDDVSMVISRGRDTVWSSEQCSGAIPTQVVAVRQAAITQVPVVWADAARSDDECSDRTAYAMPGVYTVSTAVLGGEPTDVQFELAAPAAPVVTQTVTPTVTAEPAPAG
ncbi:hypothetical protein [Nocardioides flavescens]|uniref:DUF4232 domain-containing protein n=1 Tax=Nocardioides flavescens TaxID=2691959 RepID=A0A6L7ESZ0_9ACTN|nr:hypothetical protein [Nocardioides flavescens]MXG89810.1 hypothetical protein [Nocardioides flavescens]